jgi:hypothetical protein
MPGCELCEGVPTLQFKSFISLRCFLKQAEKFDRFLLEYNDLRAQ